MRRTVFSALLAAAVLLPAAGVMAQSVDDNAMAQHIGIRLKESGQLHDYRVGVKYADGVAWLTGSVTSQGQADVAIRLAEGVDGVSHVVNRLTIAGQTEEPAAFQPMEAPEPVELASYQTDRLSKEHRSPGLLGANKQKSSSRSRSTGQYSQRNVNQPSSMRPRVASSRGNASFHEARQSQPGNRPMPAQYMGSQEGMMPMPMAYVPGGNARAVSYDSAQMPGYAWPSYSAYPNYAALSYPRQYSPTAWPYIGPFYPYPQVPLGWRKVSLEWDDGWWFLDFSDRHSAH